MQGSRTQRDGEADPTAAKLSQAKGLVRKQMKEARRSCRGGWVRLAPHIPMERGGSMAERSGSCTAELIHARLCMHRGDQTERRDEEPEMSR